MVKAKTWAPMIALILIGVRGAAYAQGLAGVKADRVVVEKRAHTLTLYARGAALKTYRVALGFNELGPKMQKGDGRTPEGVYKIDGRKSISHYHLALHISYPSGIDQYRASRRGVMPGGDIYIHGTGERVGGYSGDPSRTDWTDGCIAV